MHLRHQADERVARVDVTSSGVMVTFRFAADKVVPKRERVKAPFNEVAPGQCQGSPESSVGKESTCNAGDPGSIPGSGRSPGEGLGYSLQYTWASLVAHLVKNPPAIWETWVRSLVWADPLEKGKATHSSILA